VGEIAFVAKEQQRDFKRRMGDGAHAFPVVLPELPVNAQVEGDLIE
jgi:hypothetical protein